MSAGRYLTFRISLEKMRNVLHAVSYEWLPDSPYRAASGEVPDDDERYDRETSAGVYEVIFSIR